VELVMVVEPSAWPGSRRLVVTSPVFALILRRKAGQAVVLGTT
jgi:hypothetical protein